MAEYLIQDTTLTEIADAIRAKTGKTDAIPTTDMASEIAGIQTGTGGGSVETCTVTYNNRDESIYGMSWCTIENDNICGKAYLGDDWAVSDYVYGDELVVVKNTYVVVSLYDTDAYSIRVSGAAEIEHIIGDFSTTYFVSVYGDCDIYVHYDEHYGDDDADE